MKRTAKKKPAVTPVKRFETPGSFDKDGIYRLQIPMESYDIVKHYQKIAGKLANFIDDAIPYLLGNAYLRESVLRILGARYGKEVAASIVDNFVRECRHFQTALAIGFSKLDWTDLGERIARDKRKAVRK